MRTLQVTGQAQPLIVGLPLNKSTGGLGWTLANNDQTNQIWVSTKPGVKSTDSDAIPCAPLGSIPIDPSLNTYVVSAGPTVQAFIMPGGGSWSPSPAQIAAQLVGAGLALNSTVQATNTVLGSGIALPVGAASQATLAGVAKDATLTGGIALPVGAAKDVSLGILGTGIALPAGAAKDASLGVLTTGIALPVGAAKDSTVTGVAKDATVGALTSGATIATDINTAGVPLASKSSVIFSNLSHVITHALPQWTPFSLSAMTKPTYEVFLSLGTMAADTQPWAEISLFWFDSASGQQLSQQDYVLAVGTTTACTYHGIGPIHGDRLSVIVTNFSAVSSLTAGLIVLNNANPALNELWRSEVTASVNGSGNGFMNNDMPANYLGGATLSIGTGGTDARLLPLYVGAPMSIRVNTASNTSDCEAILQMPSSMVTALGLNALTGGNVYADYNTDSKGLIQQIFNSPRFMLQIQATNHNASSQNITRVVGGTI